MLVLDDSDFLAPTPAPVSSNDYSAPPFPPWPLSNAPTAPAVEVRAPQEADAPAAPVTLAAPVAPGDPVAPPVPVAPAAPVASGDPVAPPAPVAPAAPVRKAVPPQDPPPAARAGASRRRSAWPLVAVGVTVLVLVVSLAIVMGSSSGPSTVSSGPSKPRPAAYEQPEAAAVVPAINEDVSRAQPHPAEPSVQRVLVPDAGQTPAADALAHRPQPVLEQVPVPETEQKLPADVEASKEASKEANRPAHHGSQHRARLSKPDEAPSTSPPPAPARASGLPPRLTTPPRLQPSP